MKLHSLKPATGAVKGEKRIARGQGSGKGGTATKGTKGNQSRAGYKHKRKFEGGQTPIQMRVPKRGFNNTARLYKSYDSGVYTPFNLDKLSEYIAKYNLTEISAQSLYSNGLISKTETYKVLGNGQLSKGLDVTANRFSASAKAAIEQAGGRALVSVKLSQVQGLVDKYHLKYVDVKTLATYFDFIGENDKVHVIEEGDLTLKFDLSVHKISAAAQAQVEARGGKVTILA